LALLTATHPDSAKSFGSILGAVEGAGPESTPTVPDQLMAGPV
jgi:hypothetical protein